MEGDEGKGTSGVLEINHQGTVLAPPRSDLFIENRNANVVQHMNLKHQLERTDPEEEEEVKIVNVLEGNVAEEGEMKGALEKIFFGGLLLKASRRLKPARKGRSERFISTYKLHVMVKLCSYKIIHQDRRGQKERVKATAKGFRSCCSYCCRLYAWQYCENIPLFDSV